MEEMFVLIAVDLDAVEVGCCRNLLGSRMSSRGTLLIISYRTNNQTLQVHYYFHSFSFVFMRKPSFSRFSSLDQSEFSTGHDQSLNPTDLMFRHAVVQNKVESRLLSRILLLKNMYGQGL